MNWLRNNLIVKILTDTYRLLSPSQRRKSVLMIFTILIMGIMDFFGLASVLPVIYMATNLSTITTNPYISPIYYQVGIEDPKIFLLLIVLLVLLLFIIKNSLAVIFLMIQTRFSYEIAFDLTERKFDQFYKTKYAVIKETNSNVIATNIATIPVEFAMGVMLPLFIFLSEMVVVVFLVAGIAVADYRLMLLLAAVLLPATIFFYRAVRNYTHELGNTKNSERYFMYQYLYQNIQGFVDVLLLNKVKYFLNKYFEKQKKLYEIYIRLGIIENIPNRFLEVIAFSGLVIIFCYCFFTGLDNSYLVTFLTLFVMAAYRMIPSINRIIIAIVKIKSTQYVMNIFQDAPYDHALLQSLRSKIDDNTTPPDFSESLEFKDVSFQYRGAKEKALDHVSFEIKKGEVVGFIGTSGSGKTTMFNVLLRMLKEDSGNILLDGKPITENEINGWRKMIGYVRQDFYLIDSSLAENIAFGIDRKEIDEAKVMDCIERASLSEFLKTLPQGINTHLGEFGGKLSGGQKQRVAIARALYHESEIILFDEATSALDNETENEIIETINNLFTQQKTMLMIAHRYTTLKKCNRIYEMKDGKIIQVHSYEDLIHTRIQN